MAAQQPTDGGQVPSADDVEQFSTVSECAAVLGMSESTASKVVEVLEKRASTRNVAQHDAVIKIENWLAEARKDDDKSGGILWIASSVSDYSEKAWKLNGAAVLDDNLVLPQDPATLEDEQLTTIIDTIDDRDEIDADIELGECWLPKSGTSVIAASEL